MLPGHGGRRHRVAGLRGWQCCPSWAREGEGHVVGQTVALLTLCLRSHKYEEVPERQISMQVKFRPRRNRATDLSNIYTQTASVSAFLLTGEITREQVLMESRWSRMQFWEGSSGDCCCQGCKGGARREGRIRRRWSKAVKKRSWQVAVEEAGSKLLPELCFEPDC